MELRITKWKSEGPSRKFDRRQRAWYRHQVSGMWIAVQLATLDKWILYPLEFRTTRGEAGTGARHRGLVVHAELNPMYWTSDISTLTDPLSIEAWARLWEIVLTGGCPCQSGKAPQWAIRVAEAMLQGAVDTDAVIAGLPPIMAEASLGISSTIWR
jgi:hypothetical protein